MRFLREKCNGLVSGAAFSRVARPIPQRRCGTNFTKEGSFFDNG